MRMIECLSMFSLVMSRGERVGQRRRNEVTKTSLTSPVGNSYVLVPCPLLRTKGQRFGDLVNKEGVRRYQGHLGLGTM
jgi:hypothetical protein